jgi:Cu/Zn superoxide dismutase
LIAKEVSVNNAWMLTIFFLASFSLASCSRNVRPDKAYAELVNPQGKKIGRVAIRQVQDKVRFRLYVDSLPKGTYGFAVYDFGDCDLPAFVNAGNPFPANESPATTPALSQALGEIHADDGVAIQKEVITGRVTLREGQNSLLHSGGTSLVIYRVPAELEGMGDTGDRVACGVIFPTTKNEDVPQSVPEGGLEDANTPRDMDVPGEIHQQPK